MFGQLLIKECRQTARSLIYWLIVLVLIFDYTSQLGSTKMEPEPEKGLESYGYKPSDDENIIMEATLGMLTQEYGGGCFATYPIGFYKRVTLNEKEEQRIEEILRETTGISGRDEAGKLLMEWYEAQNAASGENQMYYAMSLTVKPAQGLSYDRFCELMDETDRILGGGSSYGEHRRGGSEPKTYEDALKEYQDLTEKDRLTGGYARLFCDYMVIFLGILPVFLAVTRGMRDRRCGMQELVYSRKGSSAVIIFSRFAAMLLMLLIPVLLLSVPLLTECLRHASKIGISVDLWAFAIYTLGWIMPTVMAVTAVGMFFTELTDTALGVLVQGVWWFVSALTGTDAAIRGGMYGWNLIPRHNTELNRAGFEEGFAQLAANRILYVVLALALVALTTFIYSQKRKGRYRLAWKNTSRLKKQI
ncbi:MAG: ABC transporter permease [Ruminococcus sp.]|nr:ABC transporter permease [Ruminococcus sp.]